MSATKSALTRTPGLGLWIGWVVATLLIPVVQMVMVAGDNTEAAEDGRDCKLSIRLRFAEDDLIRRKQGQTLKVRCAGRATLRTSKTRLPRPL